MSAKKAYIDDPSDLLFSEEYNLSPFIKWAGGKKLELKHIIPNSPCRIRNYFEPFVGGGAVLMNIRSKHMYINDKSKELINLYNIIKSNNSEDFFSALNAIDCNWKFLEIIAHDNRHYFLNLYKNYSTDKISNYHLRSEIEKFILRNVNQFNGMFSTVLNYNKENFLKEVNRNLVNKISRMKKIEKQKTPLPYKDILDNFETAFKSAFYMHLRYIYNNLKRYEVNSQYGGAIFYFIRTFAYSGMFRYNSKGGFNVPYGGIGYNRKDFAKKIQYLKSKNLKKHLSKTVVESVDFETFLRKHSPDKDDFIFLDPPYDTNFSTYAKNTFTQDDQKRLANYLLHECKSRWMLVIKDTDFISNLYNNKNLTIKIFNKKYLVSFMNRNNKNTKHLLITNY